MGHPRWLSGKESPCKAGDMGSIPESGKIPWKRKGLPAPVFLLGESCEQGSLVGYSPLGHKRVRLNLETK